jgi:hypothetical protein
MYIFFVLFFLFSLLDESTTTEQLRDHEAAMVSEAAGLDYFVLCVCLNLNHLSKFVLLSVQLLF